MTRNAATNVTYSPNAYFPQHERKQVKIKVTCGDSLSSLLNQLPFDTHNLDVHAFVNDKLIPRAEWDTYKIQEKDIIALKQRVHGGDDSNPLAIIAMIAIVVFAPYLGGQAAAAFGFAAEGLAASVFSAVIVVAGSALINSIFPPNIPSFDEGKKQSPTYSLTGGRNVARPNEPIPVVVGTHKMYPDLGAKPYTTQSSEDVYLNQVFNFGFGNLTVSNIKIGDTAIANYNEVTTELSVLNGELDLFPQNVDSITGAELTYDAGYIIRTSSTGTTRLVVDLEGSLFRTKDDGTFTTKEVKIHIQYRAVGAGSWTEWAPYSSNPNSRGYGRTNEYEPPEWGTNYTTLYNDDSKPFRRTFSKTVAEGQYEVRIKRLSRESDDPKIQDRIIWQQLKSYQRDQNTYPFQTRYAVRIRASGQLNGTIEALSADVSNAIPSWNPALLGGAGDWETVNTSNPAWIFLYLARGLKDGSGRRIFGAGLADARIDIEGIKDWGAWCDTKSLECNYVFDQKQTIADMLSIVARCGRGSLSWQKGVLGVVYDEESLPVTQVFGMGNIKRDSFEVEYVTKALADQIQVGFINKDLGYQVDTVEVNVPNVVTPINPVKIDIAGITNVTQAGKEANLLAARQYYQRRRITFRTDIEGLVCSRGDVITLSHDLTNWGVSGRLTAGTTTILTLDRDITFENAGNYYIGIRYPDTTFIIEQVSNPYVDTPITTNVVTLLAPLPSAPDSDVNNTPNDYTFVFDPAATAGQKFKVIHVVPQNENEVQLICTDEVDAYYTSENNAVSYTPPTLLNPANPSVSNVQVVENYQGLDKPLKLYITWDLTDAPQTLLRVRRNQVSWQNFGTLDGTEFTLELIDYANGDEVEIELTALNPFVNVGSTAITTVTYLIQGLPTTQTNVNVPVVSGLELFGSGNNQEFTGKDAKFVWRRTSTTTPEVGSEELGAETGQLDDFFADYQIHIFDGSGLLIREEYVKNEEYVYTYEKNAEDNGGSAIRDFKIAVKMRTNTNQLSPSPALLSVNNPAPVAPSNVLAKNVVDNLYVKADASQDLDYTGMIVHLDTSPSFTPTALNEVHRGSETSTTIDTTLAYDTTYYVKVTYYDGFGETGLNYTEVSFVATRVSSDDVSQILGVQQGVVTDYNWNPTVTDPMGNWIKLGGALSETTVSTVEDGPFTERPAVMSINGTAVASAPSWFGRWKHDFDVDPERSYVAYVWVKRKTSSTSRGLYLGWSEDATRIAAMGGTGDGNPYFVSNVATELTADKWYLAVGYLNATGNTTSTNLSGIYDPDDGTKVYSGTDYKHFDANVSLQYIRLGFYSNTTAFDATEGFKFANPTVFLVNGAEPSYNTILRRVEEQGLLATISEVTAAEFAADVTPIELFATAPVTGNFEGRQYFNTTDGKLYRYTSGAWTAEIAATDISGQIDLATQSTGAIDLGTQVSGTLTSAFADSGLINSNVTINADGTLTGAGGGQASLTSLPGQVQVGSIAANAVTAGTIAALSITAGEIAAGTITGDKIFGNTITANEIAANTITADEIAGNTITANEIAGNTITANEIAGNTITAGQIAAGAISTSELAADSVTTEKLVVKARGRALNDDAFFEDGLNTWYRNNTQTTKLSTESEASLVAPTSGSPVGAPANNLRWLAADTAGDEFFSNRIPIDAGKNYRVSTNAIQLSGTAKNYLLVAFYDSAGALISGSGSGATGWTSLGTYFYWQVANQSFPASWTKYTHTFGPDSQATIPSNAKSFAIGALVIRDVASGDVYFSDFRVEESVDASLVVDGSITAGKISTANLAAINADMGAVTAGTITLDSTGHVKSGQSAFDTGTGFWLGIDSGTAKFSIGDPAGDRLTWDGDTLVVSGRLKIGEYLSGTTFLLAEANTERSSTLSFVWTKRKEFYLPRDGFVRVAFDMRVANSTGTTTAQGAARVTSGLKTTTVSTTSTTWQAKAMSFNLEVDTDELTIDLRPRQYTSGGTQYAYTYIRNVKIYTGSLTGEYTVLD